MAAAEKAKTLQDLPDELRQALEITHAKRLSYIDGLSKIIAKKRDEAVTARRESGIETIWKEDREYYLGVDDANRSTHPMTKGMGLTDGLQSNKSTDGEVTAFFNITRQFVDAAAARMGDILLPAGDWNFSISPTPVPELDAIKDSQQGVVNPDGTQVNNSDGTPHTLGQFASKEMAEAAKKVEKAETRIRDWLTECNYHSSVRRVIDDAALIGTGVIRGAYPSRKKSRVVLNGKLEIKMEVAPTSKRVDPDNFFPDPSCGDNIQNGGYVIERDYMTARQIRDLIGQDGYITESIKRVLEEGPDKRNIDATGSVRQDIKTEDDDRYPIWYFFGDMNLDDLEAFNIEKPEGKDAVPAIGVMINSTLVKGFLNPLDNGEFPYDVMPWQRINDSIWGIGVARQGRVAQDMLNAGGRALMSNMALSSAPQIIIRQSGIRPVDGEWKLVRGKFWYATEEVDSRSVADAFISINIPSMQVELEKLMAMASKMMEDSTGVTYLLQGQQGAAPDTVGGMELLHKTASALLRRIARVFDENITEPHIRRYYDWLLINGKNDDEKGDLQINAIGSSALVEREIQATQAIQILNMASNPIYEMSPIKAKNELLRAWRFEPSKFDMDDDEKKAAAQKQPAPAPAVQVAQIRVASAEKIAAAENQLETQLAQAKATHEQQTTAAELDQKELADKNKMERDSVYVQAQTARDKMDYQAKVEMLQMQERLAMITYANQNKMTLDKVKAALTGIAMKLNVQKELSANALIHEAELHGSKQAAELHMHALDSQAINNTAITPPTEPTGKAQPGQSFGE